MFILTNKYTHFHLTTMSTPEKIDINVKILLIGDSNVGKSW